MQRGRGLTQATRDTQDGVAGTDRVHEGINTSSWALASMALTSAAVMCPSRSAASIAARAIRSFKLPVGLPHSSFATMRAQPGGATLRSSAIGVLAMASKTVPDMFTDYSAFSNQ